MQKYTYNLNLTKAVPKITNKSCFFRSKHLVIKKNVYLCQEFPKAKTLKTQRNALKRDF